MSAIGAVADLKQACLDCSSASLAFFDLLEQHGLDAAWEDPTAVVKLAGAYETIRQFLLLQTTARMRGLGLSYEQINNIRNAGRNGA